MLSSESNPADVYLRTLNALTVFSVVGFYLIPSFIVAIFPISKASVWHGVGLLAALTVGALLGRWLAKSFTFRVQLLAAAILVPSLSVLSYPANRLTLIGAVVLIPLVFLLLSYGIIFLRKREEV